MLVEFRFRWDVFTGIPNDVNSILGWVLATEVAVYLIKAYEDKKIQINRKIIRAKGRAHPPGEKSEVKSEEREGKFISNFLVQWAERPSASL